MSRVVFALGLAASCLAACQMGGVTGSSSGQPASGPLIAPMSVDLSGPTAQAGATVTSAGATMRLRLSPCPWSRCICPISMPAKAFAIIPIWLSSLWARLQGLVPRAMIWR